jgi:hypothetical protein
MQNQNPTSEKALKAAIGLWVVLFVATVIGLHAIHDLAVLGAKVCLLAAVVLFVFPLATAGIGGWSRVRDAARII